MNSDKSAFPVYPNRHLNASPSSASFPESAATTNAPSTYANFAAPNVRPRVDASEPTETTSKSLPPHLWNFKRLFYRFWDRDKEDALEGRRVVRANDSNFNSQFSYCTNEIKTSRYNVITFSPINLLEQFSRIANVYFVLMLALQSIPTISAVNPLPNGIAVAIVFFLTAVKYAADDIGRHRSDRRINCRKTNVVTAAEGNSSSSRFKVEEIMWKQVKIGQILMLRNNDEVPADMVILSSSEGSGVCFIETSDLDGETNLKYRVSLEKTQQMLGNQLDMLGKFDGEVRCEPPNNHLTRFNGCLLWRGETLSLNNDNLLLRGCTVRNTEWVFGLVLYAGRQTKLMKNSGKTHRKRTRIDIMSNRLLIGVFLLMLCLMGIAAGLSYNWEFSRRALIFKFMYGVIVRIPGLTVQLVAGLQMFGYLILLQTLVPIALYITFESIQALLSRGFINSDPFMYHAETDTPAQARSTSLNEELGQVHFVFSDKTGTLTQNIMTFNMCSIGGRRYGHKNEQDAAGRQPIDFSKHEPNFWEPTFRFYDPTLLDRLNQGSQEVHDFFILLATCHTLNAEIDQKGKLNYKAQSPDEAALVGAARNFGIVYKSRTQSSITIEIFGEAVTFELLCLLDFDNERKRMSIIVQRDGKRTLLCKGADSSVLPLVQQQNDILMRTKEHLHDFASEGLRTLCCASREVGDDEWRSWLATYKDASTALDDREQKLLQCYCEIEQNLTLLGATAVEDKLQEGVPETILKLSQAGIKVWVLTGDKQETAINVGHSCHMLNDSTREFIINAETFTDVEQQLLDTKTQLEQRTFPDSPINNLQPAQNSFISFGNGNGVTLHNVPPSTTTPRRHFALIINGHSLFHAFSKELEDLFLTVACRCDVVICCRVAPLQKGKVVELVKRKRNVVTLAIGDGGNDVSMIKAAHVGVGISGQEGRQAVLSSDFAFAQFRFLQRLLFVHGRRSYFRVAIFMRFFFYKTFAFTLGQVWYSIYHGWSAQTLYDAWFIMCYNLFFTSLPVFYYAVFEQDVTDHYSLKFPKLYTPGLKNYLFNWRTFGLSCFEGVFTSFVTFFTIKQGFADQFATPDGQLITTSKAALGVACGTACVIVVTARISCVETAHWNVMNWAPVISLATMFVFQFMFSFAAVYLAGDFENLGILSSVWLSPIFWLSTLAAVSIVCLPVYTVRFLHFIFKPSLTNRVQILSTIEGKSGLRQRFKRPVANQINQQNSNANGVRGMQNASFEPDAEIHH